MPLIAYKGGLLKVNGKLAASLSCCCGEGPAPCECPEGLETCYRIVDYAPDFFDASGCTDCENCSTGHWDGTFNEAVACIWYADGAGCTGGKAVDGLFHEIILDDALCYWEMSVYCGTLVEGSLIWRGRKTTGQTPEGTYTSTEEGCDPLGSLEVEVCP